MICGQSRQVDIMSTQNGCENIFKTTIYSIHADNSALVSNKADLSD